MNIKTTVIFDLDGTLALVDKRREIAKKPNMDIAKQLLEVENLFYETELTIPSTYTNKTIGEIIGNLKVK